MGSWGRVLVLNREVGGLEYRSGTTPFALQVAVSVLQL